MTVSASRAAFAATLLAAATASAQAPLPQYLIDPTHSFAYFEVLHFGASTSRGRFDRTQGTVAFDRAARQGSAEITVEIASVSTGVPALDRRLRGPEFLDAERWPQARFVAERMVFEGARVSAVQGRLTLRGVTEPLTLTAARFDCYTSPIFKREVCGGDFEAPLVRSRFGMVDPIPGIPDQIRLLIQVEAIAQQ